MKKSLVFLLLITAVACSKNTATSKFAGAWTGTYRSANKIINPAVLDSGIVRLTVDANNNASGTLSSIHGTTPTTLKGTVNPASGVISLSEYGEGDHGIIVFLEGLDGTLSLGSAGGTLTFPWASTSTWIATKN